MAEQEMGIPSAWERDKRDLWGLLEQYSTLPFGFKAFLSDKSPGYHVSTRRAKASCCFWVPCVVALGRRESQQAVVFLLLGTRSGCACC